MENVVEKALEIATEAHLGQYRWDGETPYITHPIAVAENFKDPELKAIALMHDVVEDTVVTLEMLVDFGFSHRIIKGVNYMTHIKDEYTYYDYIRNIGISRDATLVKIADITHNFSNMNYKKNKNMINKYMLAKMYLEKCWEPE